MPNLNIQLVWEFISATDKVEIRWVLINQSSPIIEFDVTRDQKPIRLAPLKNRAARSVPHAFADVICC